MSCVANLNVWCRISNLSFYILKTLFCLCIFSTCFAEPFAEGNDKNGGLLHSDSCKSCHDSMFPNGTGDDIYDFDLRKIKSSQSLFSMVEFCANNSGLAWFEEEINDVSKYLNRNFYKFQK